jgi:hypothetical protein
VRLAVATVRDLPALEIVGVVEHVEGESLAGGASAAPQLYLDMDQVPLPMLPRMARRMNIVVRTDGDPMALAQPIRAQVAAASGRPAYHVQTMEELVSATIAPRRFSMLLFALLAAIALVTAIIGVHGLVSRSPCAWRWAREPAMCCASSRARA